MSCSTCTKVKTIPQCVSEITIGTIADLDTDVYVYFKNLATGRTQQYEAVSDGAGLVTLDTSEITFMDGVLYEVWIVPQIDVFADRTEITIEGVEYDCFQVVFSRVYDDSVFAAASSETFVIEV